MPPTSRRAVVDPSRFDSILNVQWVCRKTLSQCGKQILKEISPGGYGVFDDLAREGIREETFALSNGVAIFLLTIMSNEDDSVAGERFRVEFKRVKGGYKLTRIGRQFRCVRGGSRDWIKGLCP